MKFIASIFIFVGFSSFAYAALKDQVREQIKIETQLLVNGKVISSPHIIALAGERASITQSQVGSKQTMRLGVTAKPADPRMDEIVLDMDLKYVLGDRVIESSPQVYVKSGVDAVMTLEESSASEKIQLKVMARPVAR